MADNTSDICNAPPDSLVRMARHTFAHDVWRTRRPPEGLPLSPDQFKDGAQAVSHIRRILDGIGSIPGVRDVAIGSAIGYFTGDHIYRVRHNPNLEGASVNQYRDSSTGDQPQRLIQPNGITRSRAVVAGA